MVARLAVRYGLLAVALTIAAGLIIPPPAVAQTPPQPVTPKPAQQASPRPAQIDRNGTLILIRNTLLALNEANETGNYTVLRDMGAPGFRETNTAARLAEIFANLRAQKLDLSGIAALDPQLTILPQIEPNGLLHIAGFFPSIPTQVNFELLFAAVDSRWRPFGISVNIGSSSPTAPAAAAPTSPTPAVEPKRPEASKSAAPSATRPKP